MFVQGLKDPRSKEMLMEREQSLEKTLEAARIAKTSKQHIKSLKEENSTAENVDVADGKGQKSQCGMPCGNCSIWYAPALCLACRKALEQM